MQDLFEMAVRYGPSVVFAGVLLESLGLPIPAMPLLIIAGALAAADRMSAPLVLFLAVLACLVGDVAWFYAGKRYGQKVLKTLCRISISPDSCVRQTESFFTRWGVRTLVFAKFIPGLSTIAPPLAGALGIGLGAFVVYATLGAAVWAVFSMGLGALFHDQILDLGEAMARLGTYAIYLVGMLLAAFIAFKWWERRHFLRALRMARISVDELHHLRETGGDPVILDVRSSASRQIDPRRIPGARFVDIDSAARHLEDTPRDTDVVVYCSCPNEASAARVAQVLREHGFRRVRPLAGGLEAWSEAGYSVEMHS